AALDLGRQLEADHDPAQRIDRLHDLALAGVLDLPAVLIVLLAVDADARPRRLGDGRLAALGQRHLAGRHDFIAGAVGLAGKLQLLVQPVLLIAVDDELAFLAREAIVRLADGEDILAPRKLRRQGELPGSDAPDRLAVPTLHFAVLQVAQARLTGLAIDHFL